MSLLEGRPARDLRLEREKNSSLRARLGILKRSLLTLHAQSSCPHGDSSLLQELLRALERLDILDRDAADREERQREEISSLISLKAENVRLVELSRAECNAHEQHLAEAKRGLEELDHRRLAAEAQQDALMQENAELRREKDRIAASMGDEAAMRDSETIELRLQRDDLVSDMASTSLIVEDLRQKLAVCKEELRKEKEGHQRAIEAKREKENNAKKLMGLVSELESSRSLLNKSLQAKEEELVVQQEECRVLKIRSLERERVIMLLDQQCASYEHTLQPILAKITESEAQAHVIQARVMNDKIRSHRSEDSKRQSSSSHRPARTTKRVYSSPHVAHSQHQPKIKGSQAAAPLAFAVKKYSDAGMHLDSTLARHGSTREGIPAVSASRGPEVMPASTTVIAAASFERQPFEDLTHIDNLIGGVGSAGLRRGWNSAPTAVRANGIHG